MKLLPIDATDDDILAACREWASLMAAGRVADAIAMLYIPEGYADEQRWTVDTLTTYIANYGSWDPRPDGKTWRITPLETARVADNDPFRSGVVRSDETAGTAELDLALNGERSDLTAIFEFEPVGHGIGLSLYDLHVL